jgi:hypothetical protein
MDRSQAWFIQRKRGARPLVASWRGWVAGLVFIAAFFGLCAVFLSLNPFEPLDPCLLAAWWLSILGLMLVYHLIARRWTYRVWQQDEPSQTVGTARKS